MEDFCEKYGEDYKLVLVGKDSYFYKKLKSQITDHRSLIYLDSIDDEQLSGLYQHARLFIFPRSTKVSACRPLRQCLTEFLWLHQTVLACQKCLATQCCILTRRIMNKWRM